MIKFPALLLKELLTFTVKIIIIIYILISYRANAKPLKNSYIFFYLNNI